MVDVDYSKYSLVRCINMVVIYLFTISFSCMFFTVNLTDVFRFNFSQSLPPTFFVPLFVSPL